MQVVVAPASTGSGEQTTLVEVVRAVMSNALDVSPVSVGSAVAPSV